MSDPDRMWAVTNAVFMAIRGLLGGGMIYGGWLLLRPLVLWFWR